MSIFAEHAAWDYLFDVDIFWTWGGTSCSGRGYRNTGVFLHHHNGLHMWCSDNSDPRVVQVFNKLVCIRVLGVVGSVDAQIFTLISTLRNNIRCGIFCPRPDN